MSDSLEQQLAQLVPPEPQLDWRELWIEMGREQQRQSQSSLWRHPAWAPLSFVSTAASLILVCFIGWRSLLVESPTPAGSNAPTFNSSQLAEHSHQSLETENQTATPQPPSNHSPTDDPREQFTFTPAQPAGYGWWQIFIAPTPNPAWERKQRQVKFAAAGFDPLILDETPSAPLAPRQTDAAESRQDLLRELFPGSITPDKDSSPTPNDNSQLNLKLGDWL